MTILATPQYIRLVQSRSDRSSRLGLKKKRGPRRKTRVEKPTRAEKLSAKLERLEETLPVDTICCSCKWKDDQGVKVNHLRDHHTVEELKALRAQYYNQPTEEARKSLLKKLLRPGCAVEGEHVPKLELNGHYLCWDGVKKLFGVSKNLVSCVAATRACPKYGKCPCCMNICGSGFVFFFLLMHPCFTNSSRCSGGPNAARRPDHQHPDDFMKWDYVSCWLKMKKKFYEVQPDRREVHAPWATRR